MAVTIVLVLANYRYTHQTRVHLGSCSIRECGPLLHASRFARPLPLNGCQPQTGNKTMDSMSTQKPFPNVSPRFSCRAAGTTPFLVGHSLGGTLAAIFTALAPASTRGLILLGAPLCFEPATKVDDLAGGMAAAQGTSVASVSAAWRRCALPCQRPITALKAVTSSSIMPVSLSRSSFALASTDRWL